MSGIKPGALFIVGGLERIAEGMPLVCTPREITRGRIMVGGRTSPFRNPAYRGPRVQKNTDSLIENACCLFPRIDMEAPTHGGHLRRNERKDRRTSPSSAVSFLLRMIAPLAAALYSSAFHLYLPRRPVRGETRNAIVLRELRRDSCSACPLPSQPVACGTVITFNRRAHVEHPQAPAGRRTRQHGAGG